jgi:hypothetical protein
VSKFAPRGQVKSRPLFSEISAAIFSVQSALSDGRPMTSVGVKRKGEDVDHVFLRFGKRS